MKATELRVGNYVIFNNQQITTSWEDIQFLMTSDFENHKPIRLTEKWLFKFGFNEKLGAYYYQINDITKLAIYGTLRGAEYTKGFKGFQPALMQEKNDIIYLPKIKYVHQLQNIIFALTGKELKK